jgi:parallel beta-helix repeat protein
LIDLTVSSNRRRETMRRPFCAIRLVLLTVGMLSLALNILDVRAQPRTWTVDDDGPADFHTIQEAINAATDGDVVFVRSGVYHEYGIYEALGGTHFESTLSVNKSVSLIGECKWSTIVDNGFRGGPGIWISADGALVSGFTVLRGLPEAYDFAGILLQSKRCIVRDNVIEGAVPFDWNDFNTGIGLLGAGNNTVYGNIIYGTAEGIRILNSDENSVTNNNISSVYDEGIYVHEGSNRNLIDGNNLICSYVGIGLEGSSSNRMSRNSMSGNDCGIMVVACSLNNIEYNNITNNMWGIVASLSQYNMIEGNNVAANQAEGIWLDTSTDNTIVQNNLLQNNCGIKQSLSSENYIYHNSIIANMVQTTTIDSSATWDDGYPSGGNYWSDYVGSDVYIGPDQDQSGSDGIGDTPYLINANNVDNYPLVNPWTPTEASVRVGGKDYPVTIVSNTTLDQIVATPNTLHFRSAGPSGEISYCNVIFPIVNTTDIKVFIDGKKLTPPPFPVISDNGTHYFIYFEFTLSTHTVAIQFAPLTPSVAVGGEWISIDTLQLLTPLIALFSLITVSSASFVYVRRYRKKQS